MHATHHRKTRARLPRTALAFAVALALALGGGTAHAADSAAKPAPAGSAGPSKGDTEQARRELGQLREQMREMSRKMAELSARLGDVGPRAYAYRYLGDPDRAMVGVVLSNEDFDRTHGLRVNAVTPGGPAEKAGLRHGDIVTAIDGRGVANREDTPDALRDLKVGEEVKLTILRDGRKSELTVKAERREPYNLAFAFNDGDPHALQGGLAPDFEPRIHEQVDRAMRQAHVAERASDAAHRAMQRLSFSSPWWGLNLAGLNADLGSYFGADRGVLVLSTDSEALKALRSGDVLVEIDGNKVDRPEDALRLLREHAGSEVKVQVLRQHKPLTLSMKAPEFHGLFVPPPPPPAAPLPPEMPAPPTPPTAPTPRALPAPAARPAPPTPPTPPAPPPEERDTV